MKKHGFTLLVAIVLSTIMVSCGDTTTDQQAAAGFEALSGPYLGQEPPGAEPQLFMPGVISTWGRDGNISFFDDGKALVFASNEKGIHLTFLRDGHWIEPTAVPWGFTTGLYDFTLGGDGRTFYYASRKLTGEDDSVRNSNIWAAELDGNFWSESRLLPPPVNMPDKDAFYPTAAADGTVYYFARVGDDSPDADIYCCRRRGGAYSESERLGWPANTRYDEIDFIIAPDESYLIFASDRPGGFGMSDNYICFRRDDGSWTNALNMGKRVNSAGNEIRVSVSADGKYLFFCSTRAAAEAKGEKFDSSLAYIGGDFDVYWIDAAIIEEMKEVLLSKLSAAEMIRQELSANGLQAAIEKLKELHAAEQSPYFFSLYELLAICERMVEAGNVDEAELFYDALLTTLPEVFRIRLGYAQLCAELGLLDKSLALLGNLSADHPDFDNEEFALWIGTNLHWEDKLEEAMKVFLHVVDIFPDSAISFYYLADIHEQQGDIARAIDFCRKVLDIRPGFSFAVEMMERLEGN